MFSFNFKVIISILFLSILGVQSKSLKLFKEIGEFVKTNPQSGKEFMKTYYYSQNLGVSFVLNCAW